jgi:hypothetical protein
VEIYYYKKHIGKDITTKTFILDFAKISKELNLRRINKNKIKRIDIIIEWLENLKSFPSQEEKLNLIKLIKVNSLEILAR